METKDYSEAVIKARVIRDSPELHTGGLFSAETERFLDWKLGNKTYVRESAAAARIYFRRFIAIIGDVAPGRVTKLDASRFVAAVRAGGAGDETARTYVAYLRTFFDWCVKEARTTRQNPFLGLQQPRYVPAARKDFCEIAERDDLIRSCKMDDLRFVLFCGFHAGLRRKEISEARPDWFDLTRNLINIMKVTPAAASKLGLDPFELKDREERTIPLSPEFKVFLRRFLRPGDAYCLAPNVRRRRARYRYDFRRFFTDFMRSQNASVTAHKMRRTFASLQVSHGTPLYHVAKWLGDNERTTARHYGHLIPDHEVFHRGITGASGRKARPRSPRL